MDLKIDYNYLKQLTYYEGEDLVANFGQYKLYTALQPIFSLAHKRIVGYEALVRIKDLADNWVSPARLFNTKLDKVDVIFLDRLCRYIHVHNFKNLADQINWLFLNVHPKTINQGINYGRFFNDLLKEADLRPEQVVVEVVEKAISDRKRLTNKANYYRDNDCLLAIDDFGTGHSNFDRIWDLAPDIVKLDRSMLFKKQKNKQTNLFLPKLVSLFHQAGTLVLIEGIETKDQVMLALESGADFVQGYYFAKPNLDFSSLTTESPDFKSILKDYKDYITSKEKQDKQTQRRYSNLFKKAVDNLQQGLSLIDSTEDILVDKNVIRAYLLKKDGVQIGSTVSNSKNISPDKRFRPLADTENADWFRRHYLKQALQFPNSLQFTKPYLSINGGHMCITLSMMFETEQGARVLCCDIKS